MAVPPPPLLCVCWTWRRSGEAHAGPVVAREPQTAGALAKVRPAAVCATVRADILQGQSGGGSKWRRMRRSSLGTAGACIWRHAYGSPDPPVSCIGGRPSGPGTRTACAGAGGWNSGMGGDGAQLSPARSWVCLNTFLPCHLHLSLQERDAAPRERLSPLFGFFLSNLKPQRRGEIERHEREQHHII